mmetsp:Transcript_11878/g.40513  ORF Transcript_11878/g.40513 Transcript_11878/m.40513 type:complete len:239 (+) Transcript_11878:975-1691(+)
MPHRAARMAAHPRAADLARRGGRRGPARQGGGLGPGRRGPASGDLGLGRAHEVHQKLVVGHHLHGALLGEAAQHERLLRAPLGHHAERREQAPALRLQRLADVGHRVRRRVVAPRGQHRGLAVREGGAAEHIGEEGRWRGLAHPHEELGAVLHKEHAVGARHRAVRGVGQEGRQVDQSRGRVLGAQGRPQVEQQRHYPRAGGGHRVQHPQVLEPHERRRTLVGAHVRLRPEGGVLHEA